MDEIKPILPLTAHGGHSEPIDSGGIQIDIPPPFQMEARGSIEKLKAMWNDPKVRSTTGTAAYIAAALLTLGAVTTLVLHFTLGEIGGYPIKFTYAAMAASLATIAVLKGIQYREEAKRIKKHQQNQDQLATIRGLVPGYDEHAELPIEDTVEELEVAQGALARGPTPQERLVKGLAVVAGLLLLSVLANQIYGIYEGRAAGLNFSAATLISTTTVLSYSLTFLSRFFFQQRKELATQGSAVHEVSLFTAEKLLSSKELEEGNVRLLPNRLGKVAVFVGSAILALALVSLVAHYRFNVDTLKILDSETFLSLATIGGLAFSGASILGNGLTQLFPSRSEQEIVSEFARIRQLEADIAKLKVSLQAYRDEEDSALYKRISNIQDIAEAQVIAQHKKETLQKVVGGAFALIAIGLLIGQPIGLDTKLFRHAFNANIANDLLTITTIGSTSVGIGMTGISLIAGAIENRQEVRAVALEHQKRALEVKYRYFTNRTPEL